MNDQNTLQMQPGAIDERLGLNVHRNHWPAAPALKAVEAAGFAWVQVHTPPAAILALVPATNGTTAPTPTTVTEQDEEKAEVGAGA